VSQVVLMKPCLNDGCDFKDNGFYRDLGKSQTNDLWSLNRKQFTLKKVVPMDTDMGII
jgi:hypothetical protein